VVYGNSRVETGHEKQRSNRNQTTSLRNCEEFVKFESTSGSLQQNWGGLTERDKQHDMAQSSIEAKATNFGDVIIVVLPDEGEL
jgi:hypothetical protein